ncbi:MAG: hypothetical protein E6I23_05975 [Chloroflexi bacterium]|nr:MAG: hypothetical protein E6I23_05975 [Chloroflexota bacterium]
MIGRVFDQAHRIGMAVLVGALLTGSAGFTLLNQPQPSGTPAQTPTQPAMAIPPLRTSPSTHRSSWPPASL